MLTYDKLIEDEFQVSNSITSKCIIGLPLLRKYRVNLKFRPVFRYEFVDDGSVESVKPELGQFKIITTTDSLIMASLYKLRAVNSKLNI